MDTKTVNLRDLPEEFVRRAKAYAAMSGMTLKDFFMKAAESAMQGEIKPTSATTGLAVKQKPRK